MCSLLHRHENKTHRLQGNYSRKQELSPNNLHGWTEVSYLTWLPAKDPNSLK